MMGYRLFRIPIVYLVTTPGPRLRRDHETDRLEHKIAQASNEGASLSSSVRAKN